MVEDAMRRSGNQYHGAGEGDEERIGSGNDDHKANKLGARKERSPMEPHLSKASTSTMKDNHQGDDDDDQVIKSAKAEMGEVREENERLKTHLDRMMKDYKSLQMQFHHMIHRHQTNNTSTTVDHDDNINQTTSDREEQPHLAVSLSLGGSSSEPAAKRPNIGKETSTKTSWSNIEEGLSLGLDCKFEATTKSDAYDQSQLTNNASPTTVNSIDEEEQTVKEEAATVETWPPSKVLKTARSDDEVLQQNPTKKARVSVRARCDTPTMNDGCQWRKYGQKISKGNPCPRAYYRCTVAPSCPVRKQVQRCSDDMSILITTYEGAHNHPLPMSATAMASTTSAAASMLLSGSSSSSSASRPSLGQSLTSTTTAAGNLHGINYYLSTPNHNTSKSSISNQFYLHNSSFSSSSTSTHPTITLDLTTSTPSSSSLLFNRSSYPKYSSSNSSTTTSLNFSSSEPTSILNWGNNNGFLSYTSSVPSQAHNMNMNNNNNNIILASLNNLGSTTRSPVVLPNNHILQSYMQKNNHAADTIAAATKAITADPSFQSALAVALTSIINGNGSSGGGMSTATTGGDHFVQNFKWNATHEQYFPVAGTTATNNSNNACGTSYLNKTTSAAANSHPPGSNLMFLPPNSLPFSPPKSASASPDDRGHAST